MKFVRIIVLFITFVILCQLCWHRHIANKALATTVPVFHLPSLTGYYQGNPVVIDANVREHAKGYVLVPVHSGNLQMQIAIWQNLDRLSGNALFPVLVCIDSCDPLPASFNNTVLEILDHVQYTTAVMVSYADSNNKVLLLDSHLRLKDRINPPKVEDDLRFLVQDARREL